MLTGYCDRCKIGLELHNPLLRKDVTAIYDYRGFKGYSSMCPQCGYWTDFLIQRPEEHPRPKVEEHPRPKVKESIRIEPEAPSSSID